MRVLEISAKNFRTLENLSLEFPTNYCTLSGKNNAGKSSIIKLLTILFERRRWSILYDRQLDYTNDKTQWVKDDGPIEIGFSLTLSSGEDPALVSFIKRISSKRFDNDVLDCKITLSVDKSNKQKQGIIINDQKIESPDVKEILRKLQDSNAIYLHNSTEENRGLVFSRSGKFAAAYPIVFSNDERESISNAEAEVQKKLKRATRAHKGELESLLCKLSDKYDVEFTALESAPRSEMPFSINLNDKSSEVPLSDWGSGTQNKTRILMSILQAKKSKTGGNDDRITPIVVIEEPESFLHPSAQAEFGTILQALSNELGIQIIATSHSPYMLNQVHTASNILLRRRYLHKKFGPTETVNTSNVNQWMEPFAEHLGIVPKEFESWKPLFGMHSPMVLLVEGETDKEYFEHLRKKYKEHFTIPEKVDFLSYGGKDALKNTAMLKFFLNRLRTFLITFDLDATQDVQKSLDSLSLKKDLDYIAIGIPKTGRDAIEGLLPERVLSLVNGRETDIVMSLASKDRHEAKKALKRKYLEELKKLSDLTPAELEPFSKLGKIINKRFASLD